jgi:hypothetical protein
MLVLAADVLKSTINSVAANLCESGTGTVVIAEKVQRKDHYMVARFYDTTVREAVTAHLKQMLVVWYRKVGRLQNTKVSHSFRPVEEVEIDMAWGGGPGKVVQDRVLGGIYALNELPAGAKVNEAHTGTWVYTIRRQADGLFKLSNPELGHSGNPNNPGDACEWVFNGMERKAKDES